MSKILLTGAAGFIGSSVLERLLKDNHTIVGIDNLNSYYNPLWKKENIKEFEGLDNFTFYKTDILETKSINDIFEKFKPDYVIHLAAMAGVRYSIENPKIYQEVNIIGTLNLLEAARNNKVKKFIFASSSSVYGNSTNIPYSEKDLEIYPISPYASSKKSAELLAYTYSHLYNLNTIGLRFFTVYGPKGRPDMAPYLFTEAILKGKEIKKYGNGSTSRDYTYIDDIVDGIIRTLKIDVKCEIFNLGNSSPVTLNEFIKTLESITQKKANIVKYPIPAGDVNMTFADISKSKKMLGYKPKTSLKDGLEKFVDWYIKNRI